MRYVAKVWGINFSSPHVYPVDGLRVISVLDGDLYVNPRPGETVAVFGRGRWTSAEIVEADDASAGGE